MVLSLLVRSNPTQAARSRDQSHANMSTAEICSGSVPPGATDRAVLIFAQVPRVSTGFRSSRRQGSFRGIVGVYALRPLKNEHEAMGNSMFVILDRRQSLPS